MVFLFGGVRGSWTALAGVRCKPIAVITSDSGFWKDITNLGRHDVEGMEGIIKERYGSNQKGTVGVKCNKKKVYVIRYLDDIIRMDKLLIII